PRPPADGSSAPPPEPPVDARFVLANERTLLAWLRTSLAFVAIGVALVALRHLGSHDQWPLLAAAASCVVGMVAAVWSYGHWRAVDAALKHGR
ncbi:MAG: YidH family protein, partial [Nocardioidaceae bacterium]